MERFLSRLQQLNENKPLVGGWEEHLSNNVTEQDGVKYLHGFKLCEKKRRTDSHNLYVSDKRNYFAIRNEVLMTIKTFVFECTTKVQDTFNEDPDMPFKKVSFR